jgi:transposase
METKVLIGVDPHKATNAVAPLDELGELLERTEFPADRKGLEALERWAARFPKRRWAIEGANGLGRTLAHRLASAGENVADVPPKLSARVRVLSIGHGRKNDELDATFAALAAWRNGRLARVRPDDGIDAIRLLSERREDLVCERTRVLNRLHGLLRDLVPGGVPGMPLVTMRAWVRILTPQLFLPGQNSGSGAFLATRTHKSHVAQWPVWSVTQAVRDMIETST